MRRVELNLPVNFSALIEKGVQFAEKAVLHFTDQQQAKACDGGHALSYFVMYIFATGIIDDLDATMTQLTKVINLPLSIVIVQLKNKGVRSQDIDVGKLEKKCQFLFE